MKKIVLALSSCALLSLSAKAQRTGLWITPTAYIGGGTMTDVYPGAYDPQFSVLFGLGADASYMFNDNIGIGTGLNYGGYGYLWRVSNGPNTLDYIGAQAMLDVPLYLRLVTGKGSGFFASIGMINGFFLGSQQSLELNGSEVEKATGSESDADFSKFSLSPFVYFGANIKCGNRVQLTLGPQFAYQLSSNFNNASGGDGHYLTCALKIGIGIHAWKPRQQTL